MTRILIIEDNADLALGLKNSLEIEGYDVVCVENGLQGIEYLKKHTSNDSPNLIILDLMMPFMNGYEFLEQLGKLQCNPMVLILSAKDTEIDKVTGLKLGADDFLTKPFGLMELLARVEALIRRSEQQAMSKENTQRVKLDHIEIDFMSRRVFSAGIEVELSPKEFELLSELINQRGKVISRIELMKQVWGHQSAIESRTVDTHIAELRKKLEIDSANPKIIKTVRKIGYRLD